MVFEYYKIFKNKSAKQTYKAKKLIEEDLIKSELGSHYYRWVIYFK